MKEVETVAIRISKIPYSRHRLRYQHEKSGMPKELQSNQARKEFPISIKQQSRMTGHVFAVTPVKPYINIRP
jgi:hypothetical protein